MDASLLNSPAFEYYLIPLLIFMGRITDVTIGTLRIIYVARGLRLLSAAAGFFEVLIWLLAIRQIMANLDHWPNYVTYAAGFAVGNYVGIVLEQRIAIGSILIRIITRRDASDLEDHLRDRGYALTSLDALGEAGPVKVLFMVVKRKNLGKVVQVIKKFNPLAFYTVEDLRHVSQEVRPAMGRRALFFFRRHGKQK